MARPLADVRAETAVSGRLFRFRAAGCAGAATCEFLLGRDATLAFPETNARLAVAHPVSEEITGLDLVRETLRLAVWWREHQRMASRGTSPTGNGWPVITL